MQAEWREVGGRDREMAPTYWCFRTNNMVLIPGAISLMLMVACIDRVRGGW